MSMTAKKGFLLSAGFGTRFQPQSLHLPKPALPFLNLPQALFPASALKSAGVEDFFYNSHHLPQELNTALSPFFKRDSIFEQEILDSAGGIANAKEFLENEENFWVANGDSLSFLNDPNVLKDAYNFHINKGAIATLIGITKPMPELSGLNYNEHSALLGISRDKSALHFIGFYIFNKKIWQYLKKEKQHIFHDVLLKNSKDKTFVFDAGDRISWYETGNEKDFLTATKERLAELSKLKRSSQTYKALSDWDTDLDKNLEHFLQTKIWGHEYNFSHQASDFLCIGKNCNGDFKNLDNCVLSSNLNFNSKKQFSEKVLVDSSQWA